MVRAIRGGFSYFLFIAQCSAEIYRIPANFSVSTHRMKTSGRVSCLCGIQLRAALAFQFGSRNVLLHAIHTHRKVFLFLSP